MFVRKLMPINKLNLNLLFTKFVGFSIVGAIISILGLIAIYVFIGLFKKPLYITYVLIYFFSILLSYILNMNFVFKMKSNMKRTAIYFLIYISSMIIGLLVLILYSVTLPYENWILSYLTIPITLTWNFLLSYLLLPKFK